MQRMVERELDAAETAFGESDWESVLQHVEKALRLDPDNPDAIELQAAAEEARGGGVGELLAKATTAANDDDWATALEHAEEVLAADPDNDDAREIRDVAEKALAGGDRTTVFVSSAMQELKDERNKVEATLRSDRYFEPWLFDRDAVALDHSAQDEWRKRIERRGVGATVVLLWKKLGEWTQDEIEWSRESGVATLLFIKDDPAGTLRNDHGEYLDELTNPATGLTSKSFRHPAVIGKLVVMSLSDLLKDRLDPNRKAELDDDAPITGVRHRAAPTDAGYRSDETPVPAPSRLAAERQRPLPENVSGFVNRTTDTKKVAGKIRSRQFRIVSIVGVAGVGKKALLRHVADDDTLGGVFGDGVAVHPDVDLIALSRRPVAPPAGETSAAPEPGVDPPDPLEDLLQAIWEQFYDADPSTVRPDDRRRQLGGMEALIALPDADGAIGYVEQLTEIMPKSVFCVTLEQPFEHDGRITLDGLAEPDDMIGVFERAYLSAVPPEAHQNVVALCARADGNPGRIRLLASRAYDEAFFDAESDGGEQLHPLIGWAASRARAEQSAHQGDLVPPEAAEVGAVTATTDSAIARPVLAATVGSTASLDEANAHEVVTSKSPRYRLNPVLADTIAPNYEILPRLFDNTVSWAELAETAELYANREFVLEMLHWGVEHERWEQVIALGRKAEPAMAVGGRHGAWKELLEAVADAAQSIDDDSTLAWALHQLGTRSLLRDENARARWLLHRAFRTRPTTDAAGREVTHHNMSMVPGAITPVTVLASATLIVTSWLAAVLPPPSPDEPAVIADVDPDVQLFDPGDEHPFTLRNAGDAAFRIGTLEADDFTVIDAPCLSVPIEPGGDCSFSIRFDGDDDSDEVVRTLDLKLEPVEGDDTVEGDRTILLLGGPPAP